MNGNNDKWWVTDVFPAVAQGLSLSPTILRRMKHDKVLGDMDEARLSRLVEPLPLCRPVEVASKIEKAGGTRILFSEVAQKAIASWNTLYQAVGVLRELSRTVLVLMRSYRQRQLANPQAVLRILPVLAMSRFVPGSEALRADLAAILKCSEEDGPGLIRGFRTAALSVDAIVLEMDQRIKADPVWSNWVQVFVAEGKDLCRVPRPVTHWEFPDIQITDRNTSKICNWLFRRS